jgi:glutamate dehydrogenase (NAD(P)+)
METVWERDEAQLVCTVLQGGGVLGYVVIDSTVSGRATGGLRMLPDIDEAEMRGLARAMTLKYGFLGQPRGGAKAGVRGDPEAPLEERQQRLAAFGRAIAPLLLKRVYAPATDMGTTNADIQYLLESIGMRLRRRELRPNQSGDYTALTVFAGAKQAARQRGLVLSECSVAIEGFGKVGSPLARLLAEAGARVVAISTLKGALFNPQGLDVRRLQELAAVARSAVVERYPDAECIDRAALLELPVDILCPCARHDSLHVGNAPRIAARIICPGANNPVTPEAERVLFERGVLCLPDFVANCGGVLGGTMEFASVSRERIESFVDRHIGARIARLLGEAERRRVLPREIAVPLALRRFEEVQRSAAHPTPLARLFELGLEFYRRGWVPGPLVAALSLPYFERCLA